MLASSKVPVTYIIEASEVIYHKTPIVVKRDLGQIAVWGA